MRLVDLIGKRFGELTVLGRAPDRMRRRRWLCICSCGTTKIIEGMALKQGKTRSCGCHQGRIIHGHNRGYTASRTHRSWSTMKTRCLDHNNSGFKFYGARGIQICERWMDFQNFLADMGERPPNTSIERRDNNGNYEPGNCYWATRAEQSNNTRRNIWLEHQGQRHTVSVWARKVGLAPSTLATRIKRGWSVERALTLAPFKNQYGPIAELNKRERKSDGAQAA